MKESMEKVSISPSPYFFVPYLIIALIILGASQFISATPNIPISVVAWFLLITVILLCLPLIYEYFIKVHLYFNGQAFYLKNIYSTKTLYLNQIATITVMPIKNYARRYDVKYYYCRLSLKDNSVVNTPALKDSFIDKISTIIDVPIENFVDRLNVEIPEEYL